MAMRRQPGVCGWKFDEVCHRMCALGNRGRGDAQQIGELDVSCNQHVFDANPDSALAVGPLLHREQGPVQSEPTPSHQQSGQRLQRCQPCARLDTALRDAVLTAPTSRRNPGANRGTQVERSAPHHARRGPIDGSIRTPRVHALLKLRTPQAVHRLRSRAKLIGSAAGNQTCFPAWQFDGDWMRLDLPRIL
jgi:hypothetical protein